MMIESRREEGMCKREWQEVGKWEREVGGFVLKSPPYISFKW